MPTRLLVIWLPATEEAQDFIFKIPGYKHYLGGGGEGRNMTATAAAVLPSNTCSKDKKWWVPVYSWTSQESKNAHMCRRSHREMHPQMQNAGKHTSEDAPLNVFPFECKRQPIGETDGIISNHENCSWPQLMIENNPNECYTIFMIAILLSAYGLVGNVNCYANLSNGDKYRWAK